MRTFSLFTLALLLTVAITLFGAERLQFFASSMVPESVAEPTYEVLAKSEVEWEQLNPARGDQSPKAGTLWGDRTGPGPSGFLLNPVDDFESPPHIHGIAYRGVAISGLIHNDDPNADKMWMSTGSFWTQPAGGVHITAAQGSHALAYIEVEDAFDVQPAEAAFESEEQPVNVDASNIIWLDAANVTWIEPPEASTATHEPKLAFLWGNPQDSELNGTLLKLPTGFTGKIHTYGSAFRAVVIQGQVQYQLPGESDNQDLEPGSYLSSTGEFTHPVRCAMTDDCIFYVRMEGKYDVVSRLID
ncbi:MAG: DUF4437 domain-containing protein [Spirulinaceae cyanobacterium]